MGMMDIQVGIIIIYKVMEEIILERKKVNLYIIINIYNKNIKLCN
jgi:hypothetical protein